MGIKTSLFVLNPKALTLNELYGILDPDTRDWTDGLLSHLFRELNRSLHAHRKENRFLVFDGDADAVMFLFSLLKNAFRRSGWKI